VAEGQGPNLPGGKKRGPSQSLQEILDGEKKKKKGKGKREKWKPPL